MVAKKKSATKKKAVTKKVAVKKKVAANKSSKKTSKKITTKKKSTVDVGGRPTQYKALYAEQARKLCLLGATDKDMAAFFQVAESTLYLWKNKHKGFSEALIAGKLIADATVAESLYKRANGYEHPDVHISINKGKVIKTKLTKMYPPDTGAIVLWLTNRQRHLWKSQKDVNVGGQQGNPLLTLALHLQGSPLPIKEV